MRRPPTSHNGRRSAIAACLAIAACTAPPTTQDVAPGSTAQPASVRLFQLGHGRLASFGWCQGDDCPRRTPKTLAGPAAPAPVSVSVPATNAPPASVRPVAPVDSMADGEELIGSSARPTPSAPLVPEPHETAAQLSIQFPFASARLDAAARTALREIAPQLRQATDVRLSGRTDSTGPALANDLLAKERAEAVRRELLVLAPGIATVLTVEAQGACCFVDSNDSAAGRARNRRVDILYRIDGDDPP